MSCGLAKVCRRLCRVKADGYNYCIINALQGWSKDKLQGDLDLAGRPGGSVDDPEPGAANDVGRQTKIHKVEDIKELRPELQGQGFRAPPVAEGSVFDNRQIEIAEARPSKSVPPQRAEAAALGAAASRNADGDIEERGVVGPLPEIVFPNFPPG